MLQEKLEKEFLRSIPSDYELTKKKIIPIENDNNNNKVEAVDIIHFAKSALIVSYGQDLNALMTDYNACSTTYMEEDLGLTDNATGVSGDLLSSFSAFTLTLLNTDDKQEALNIYMFLVNSLCNYANMDPEEMTELYMKKNKLNHERVEGGYTESADAYEKVDENGDEDNVKLFED